MKRLVLPSLVTIGIIFFLFTQISFRDLYSLLSRIDPAWTIAATAGYLLAILFRAFKYKSLIHSKDVPTSDLFRISVFTHLSLMILPSKLGELTYPYFLKRVSRVTMTEGVASLIASRIYDFFTLLLIFLVAIIGFQGSFKMNPLKIILMIALLIGLTFLAFFYMSNFLNFLSRILERVFLRARLSRFRLGHWGLGKVRKMAEDFDAIQAKRTYLSASLASLSSWACTYWMFYAFLRGFRISIPILKTVLGSTIAIVASVFPISGLGNWGILEAGWTAGFMLVGLSKLEAIATGLGVHILLFLTSALMSLLCWLTLAKGHPARKLRDPRVQGSELNPEP